MYCSILHVRMALAAMVVSLSVLIGSFSVASADFYQEMPTTHYLHAVGTGGMFDYNHSAVDVAVSVDLDNSVGGEMIGTPVAATDWDDFIEAGWVRFAAGSSWAADNPDCVSQACVYVSSGFGTDPVDMRVDSSQRFNPGQTPWFKVERVSSTDQWTASWGYTSGWTAMRTVVFAPKNFAWIVSGQETWSTGSGDVGAAILSPGVRHRYNMYSTTSFGNGWTDFGNACNNQIKPWCYTHIQTSQPCSSCGLTKPFGQSNPPFTSGCSGTCITLWTTQSRP